MALVRIAEYVVSSKESWEDAVKKGFGEIVGKFKEVRGIDVIGLKAVVREGKITEYRVNLKVSYLE